MGLMKRVGFQVAIGGAAAGIALLFMTGSAWAQEPDPQIADLIAAIDTAWLLIAAFLVFFMQAGFAMLEAGFVRSKNVANILMKNLLDVSAGAIAFWAIGWGIAYGFSGDATNGFVGNGHFFLVGFDDWASWIFQFAFAATAATIVSGAMAERTAFRAYLFYTVFITGLIYPVVVHWVWDGNGWLTAFTDNPIGTNGYLDFAGSSVVHMVGGFAGLMGAIIVGPRIGKYGKDGSINPIPGHSISLAALGVFILWFGWYGFNPGSTLGLTGGFADLAAKVAVNTTLAAGAGAVGCAFLSRARSSHYDMGLTLNGALGGLVAITAPCAVVEPWAAVIIGLIAAPVVIFGIEGLDRLGIDDPIGAVAVHGFAGIWGVLSVGLFASQSGIAQAYVASDQYGLLLGGGVQQLGIQALGVVVIAGWTMATSGLLFTIIKYTVGLRVSPEEEERGLDLGEHGVEAYPDFQPSPSLGGASIIPGISGTVSTAPTSGRE
ncbi:MAG: ammonium transporter [Chloroflexi bacterium]|nr:ammonium transporter [Chloroflexota bacterium]